MEIFEMSQDNIINLMTKKKWSLALNKRSNLNASIFEIHPQKKLLELLEQKSFPSQQSLARSTQQNKQVGAHFCLSQLLLFTTI